MSSGRAGWALLGAVLFLPLSGWADGSGGQAGASLRLGADARALGLGQAFSAAADGASAAFWNPAGLSRLGRPEVLLNYAAFPGAGDFSQMAFALPVSTFEYWDQRTDPKLGEVTLAMFLQRVAASYTLEARQQDTLNPDYLFSDIEQVFGLACGWPLSPSLRAGVGLKLLDHHVDQVMARGWGLDAGVDWETIPDLWLAVAVREAYARLDWPSGSQEPLPTRFAASAAWTEAFGGGQSLLLCAELEPGLQELPLRWGLGAEYAWGPSLSLRGGLDQGQWSCGAGVGLSDLGWGNTALRIDYALVADRIDGLDHWLTFRLLL